MAPRPKRRETGSSSAGNSPSCRASSTSGAKSSAICASGMRSIPGRSGNQGISPRGPGPVHRGTACSSRLNARISAMSPALESSCRAVSTKRSSTAERAVEPGSLSERRQPMSTDQSWMKYTRRSVFLREIVEEARLGDLGRRAEILHRYHSRLLSPKRFTTASRRASLARAISLSRRPSAWSAACVPWVVIDPPGIIIAYYNFVVNYILTIGRSGELFLDMKDVRSIGR